MRRATDESELFVWYCKAYVWRRDLQYNANLESRHSRIIAATLTKTRTHFGTRRYEIDCCDPGDIFACSATMFLKVSMCTMLSLACRLRSMGSR